MAWRCARSASGNARDDTVLICLNGKAEKLERHNLFQALQIEFGIYPVSGFGSPGRQQAQPIIVMQGFHRNPGKLRKLVNLIRATDPIPSSKCWGLAQWVDHLDTVQ